MATFQQYDTYPALSPVRVASTANVSGTYNNGPLNNGVGATLTIAATSLTVDSVVTVVGDRVLLAAQTNKNENGIYVVLSIGATVVLQRAADQQSIEQIKPGQFVTIGAGTNSAGDSWCVVEPLPAIFGINNLVMGQPAISAAAPLVVLGNITAGSTAVAGKLGSLSGAAASGELFVAAVTNSAGDFNTTISNASSVGQSQVISIPDSGATTANFILSKSAGTQHITTGSLQVDAGNLIAGLATGGENALLQLFPTTTTTGSLRVIAASNGGNFNVDVTNASHGQASVYTIPDGGQTASNFLISNSSGTQTVATGSMALSQGNMTLGSSGHAGFLTSFPGTAANGTFLFKAVNNSNNHAATLSNSAVNQDTTYTLPDPGAATAQVVVSQSAAAVNNVAFTKVITAGQAALAAAGKVNVQVHTSATSQFAILDVKVLKSTGLSGNAGDRLLSLSDGTIVFNNAGITAALLGTPILTVWGGTGNPLAVGASEISTAGADIFLQYTGGANDYNAGSVQLAITMVQVTA